MQTIQNIAEDVQAVITSYNQGEMVREAVDSLCNQTMLPSKIIIVDDGSTDEASIQILKEIQNDSEIPIPVCIVRQENSGVSAARNAGIRRTETAMVLVFDGDDRLEPEYIEKVKGCMQKDPSMIAASSWMHTFGILESVVCPTGGSIVEFLARNCCPATHIFRRKTWEKCGGYDETMRAGFEDWDYFLSMLETAPDAHIGIVQEPLMDYRTAAASANIKSMSKRLDLMRYIIEKHHTSYQNHITEVILKMESVSMNRLYGWESEICNTLTKDQKLSDASDEFMKSPSYGDGGMAAAVRIATMQKKILE